MRKIGAQTSWSGIPPQAPAAEGRLDVGGARIWYWDTGGAGEEVVLIHPYSGSALNWGYQQPVLAAAGYRVIAYSRRGHFGSDAGSPKNPGTGAGDLHQLVEYLGIDRMHLVGLAAGADILPDFAISWPERLRSLAIGCTIGKPGDPAWSEAESILLPPEMRNLPRWISELGPSYRAAFPAGVRRWRELEARSRMQKERVPVPAANETGPELIGQIETPALLFTGDADLYMPPSRLHACAPMPPSGPIRKSCYSPRPGIRSTGNNTRPSMKCCSISSGAIRPGIDQIPRQGSAGALRARQGRQSMTNNSGAGRIPMVDPGGLNPAQQNVYDKIVGGKRGGLAGPLHVALHVPELAERWSAFGEYVRFEGELPQRVRELAIISVARFWNSQVEWAIHSRIAASEGLAPEIIEAIRCGDAPEFDDERQALVYEFTRQLLEFGQVADEAYQALHARIGTTALLELTGVAGYYSLVAMTLNVHQTPLPDEADARLLALPDGTGSRHPTRLPRCRLKERV